MTPLQCLLQHLPARGNRLYPLGAGCLCPRHTTIIVPGTIPRSREQLAGISGTIPRSGATPVGFLGTIPRGGESGAGKPGEPSSVPSPEAGHLDVT